MIDVTSGRVAGRVDSRTGSHEHCVDDTCLLHNLDDTCLDDTCFCDTC